MQIALRQNLKDAYSKLYGWTADSDGDKACDKRRGKCGMSGRSIRASRLLSSREFPDDSLIQTKAICGGIA
jgi:hypothetical protein